MNLVMGKTEELSFYRCCCSVLPETGSTLNLVLSDSNNCVLSGSFLPTLPGR